MLKRCTSGAGLVLAMIAALAAPSAQAQGHRSLPDSPTGLCGPLENAYGPYDYRTAPRDRIEIVERFHFTRDVETLQRGASSHHVAGDLDYTMRAIPNHHRALYAMGRYGLMLGTARVPRGRYPVECYFDRAVRFAPDDIQVRALYANFLIRNKQPKEAKRQLEAAERLDGNPQELYNVGLAWADLGENEKAAEYARRAYDGGVKVPALRERLKAAGAWRE